MQLSRKQKEYIRESNRRYNFKIGAVRSGKSFVDTAFIIPYRMRKVAGKPGLTVFFGASTGTIERNILTPMRDMYGESLVGGIRTNTNTAFVFGEECYCIGVEKINSVPKIQGMSIKYAYGDEIAKWNPEAWAMIESRLDKEYSKFDGACNPESPNHWFKKWLDNPKLDAYIQPYVIFDNPFLPKSFIDSLCDEYEGTVYYDRYILGKWALAEGLIYPQYIHALAEMPENAEISDYCLSIDYGTENPFAALLWAKSGGVWYAVREYYYSGRDKGVPKTDEEYCDDMAEFVSDITERYEGEFERAKAFDDPFAARKKLRTIIDPSAASFITALRKRKGFKVTAADNDVADGLRETAVAMKKGLIKLSPKLKNLLEEIQGYRWDEKAGVDKPVKEKDHLMDSMRYFVKSMKIVKAIKKER